RGGGGALRKNEVGLQRDEFLGESLHQLLVQRRPAIVDPNVAAFRPPKRLESLPECGNKGLSFPVTLGKPHQHTDPPHSVGLLRARRKRPRDSPTAENRDELAAPHCRPRRSRYHRTGSNEVR